MPFPSQGRSLGMLSGHLADYLQRTGTPPRSHEGLCHNYTTLTNLLYEQDHQINIQLSLSTLTLKRLNRLLAESNGMHSL